MKIFCDLDGVLTDFDGRFIELFGKHPKEFINVYGYSSFWASLTSRAKDFWCGIQWKSDGKELWQYISPYNPIILSSVPTSMAKIATQCKEQWIKKELGPDIQYHLTTRKEKQNFSANDHLLIDDMKKNIEEWTQRGGVGILHISAHKTINELQKFML